MHFYEKVRAVRGKIGSFFLLAAPYFFTALIIFSFEDGKMAALTLLCAALHEIGHAVALRAVGKGFSFKGVLSGFRIKPKKALSYSEEILVSAAGPAVNLILFTAFLIPGDKSTGAFALLNLFTALSNLIPIKGYDGYRILRVLFLKYERSFFADNVLPKISFTLIALLTLLSLYFISRLNCGYWTFFIFIFFLLSEIKKDSRVLFSRKKEILRDFTRF